MSLEDYRTVFVASSLVLMLIVAVPAFSLIVAFPRGSERFSEFWLLDQNHLMEDYPFNVGVNESYRVFVGVGNHLGGSSHYMVYVKFRNQTEPLPNATASESSPLAPLYEFQFFVADGEIWESLLMFEILDVSVQDDSVFVGNVSINGVAFSVDCFSMWDSEHNGFYYQLFFELWLYDMMSQSFQYHDRFVGIWLNMTSS